MKLENLGFNSWFQKKYNPNNDDEYSPARVIAVDKNRLLLRNEESEVSAELTGKLLFEADSSLDYPTVGDWVKVQYFNEGTFAIVHEILPRMSLLKRKMAGGSIENQLIAANIDTAFIMQTSGSDFNIARLERYLTMVNESNIEPVILLSKADLVSEENIEKKVFNIKNLKHDYLVIPFSNKTKLGLDAIRSVIEPAKTYCLIGSSGVGKTTLINNLIGKDLYSTGNVREKDGKGKHVTTRRQMIILENGGLLIDTPGMRELASIDAQTGLDDTFKDISIFAGNCKFRNCTHTSEPGCAVLEAVENGTLDKRHFQNYLKLRKEIEYNEMSYRDKRKKDRDTGKLYKRILKEIIKDV